MKHSQRLQQSKQHTRWQLVQQVHARRVTVDAKMESVKAGVDASRPEKHAPAHVPAMETSNLTQRIINDLVHPVVIVTGLHELILIIHELIIDDPG